MYYQGVPGHHGPPPPATRDQAQRVAEPHHSRSGHPRDGRRPLLEHQRTPLIIGNKDVVDQTVSIIGNS